MTAQHDQGIIHLAISKAVNKIRRILAQYQAEWREIRHTGNPRLILKFVVRFGFIIFLIGFKWMIPVGIILVYRLISGN